MLLSSLIFPLLLLQSAAAPQHAARKPDFPKPLSAPAFLAKRTPFYVLVDYPAVVQKHDPETFFYTLKGDFTKTKEKVRKELLAAKWTLTPATSDTREVIFTRKGPRPEVRDQELTLRRGDPSGTHDDPNWTTVELKEVYTNTAGK